MSGLREGIADEHVEHTSAIAELQGMIDALPGDAAALRRLHLRLSVFVAEDFEHMQREESQMNAALWATHSDEEIMAIERRIIASHQPEGMQVALRWMRPHLSHKSAAPCSAACAPTRRPRPLPAFWP